MQEGFSRNFRRKLPVDNIRLGRKKPTSEWEFENDFKSALKAVFRKRSSIGGYYSGNRYATWHSISHIFVRGISDSSNENIRPVNHFERGGKDSVGDLSYVSCHFDLMQLPLYLQLHTEFKDCFFLEKG
ncbi:hypothetical protein CEXT_515801 [Caerostris extrusa]|uniref:Uncharacterized protein n=1 Tax=Caerostris extrusa TaxID=172846 RepID=A0AAV4RPR1_CAEEX|nr:hypothetical protein CEXT_515801 [Caerostris extrusa]